MFGMLAHFISYAFHPDFSFGFRFALYFSLSKEENTNKKVGIYFLHILYPNAVWTKYCTIDNCGLAIVDSKINIASFKTNTITVKKIKLNLV